MAELGAWLADDFLPATFASSPVALAPMFTPRPKEPWWPAAAPEVPGVGERVFITLFLEDDVREIWRSQFADLGDKLDATGPLSHVDGGAVHPDDPRYRYLHRPICSVATQEAPMEMRGLGYIGIATRDIAGWRSLMVDVLGVGESAGPPGANGDTLYLKMDDRTWRIAVHPRRGRTSARYAGWEVPGEDEFDDAVAHLQRSGVKVDRAPTRFAPPAVCRTSRSSTIRSATVTSCSTGPMVDESMFVPPHGGSGFVTDGVGLGHVLYVVPSCSDALDFFGTVMGFKVTDQFSWGPNGAVFMRSTPRHHSLAYIDLPIPGGPGLNHFMIEAKTLEDVGRAYDRAMDARRQHRQLAGPAQQRPDVLVLRADARRASTSSSDGRA